MLGRNLGKVFEHAGRRYEGQCRRFMTRDKLSTVLCPLEGFWLCGWGASWVWFAGFDSQCELWVAWCGLLQTPSVLFPQIWEC